MRILPLLALLAVSSAALAQTSAPPKVTIEPGPNVVLSAGGLAQMNGSVNCPVQLSAHHAHDTGMVRVSPRSDLPGQGYSLNFKPLNWRAVEQAKITLHGLAGAQVMPANGHPSKDATETFTVSPSTEPNHLFHSVVYVHKLTGVLWIQINDLTFADGTTWHESADSICRATPNGFMLVDATK